MLCKTLQFQRKPVYNVDSGVFLRFLLHAMRQGMNFNRDVSEKAYRLLQKQQPDQIGRTDICFALAI